MDVAWAYLVAAGLLEPCWVVFMEKSEHFRRPGYSAAMVVTLLASGALLSMAMGTIGPGTSYAIWTGIGAIGTVAAGAALFKERVTAVKLLFLAMIVAGIVGIKLTSEAGL